MDPFTSEGELVNIHTAFVQSQYTSVLSDFSTSDFSSSNALPVQILQYRAQCALSQYDEVLSAVSSSSAKSSPDLAAVRLYAQFLKSGSGADDAEQLAASSGDNLTVQLLCGSILAQADRQEQALALLAKHQGSLDAVALSIQILLAQNRTAAAQKEAKSARSFAQDALLVNLAESWIGMRRGGDEYQKAFYVFEELAQAPASTSVASLNRTAAAQKEAKSARSFAQDALLVNLAESWIGMRRGGDEYQKAFYVFEELAQAPASTSVASLVAQAVSELHMGRVEEAEAALDRAKETEEADAELLANRIVLDTIVGKSTAEGKAKLASVKKDHELLVDLQAKREAFQTAMGKYNPKFEP
nr:coatomer subunit epsilon [Quercus suber]